MMLTSNPYIPATIAATLVPVALLIWACARKHWLMTIPALVGGVPLIVGVISTVWLLNRYPNTPTDFNEAGDQFINYVVVGLFILGMFLLALIFIMWAFIGLVTGKPAPKAPSATGNY